MTKNAKYLAIILTLLSLAMLYLWFGKGSGAPAPSENDEEVPTIAEERLELLRRLKDLNLDTSILNDEKFKTLLSQEELVATPPIQTVTPGRINPFLPF